MNKDKIILYQKLVIVLLIVLTIFITLCTYKYEVEVMSLIKENEKLKGKIEYQQSVIMDLEENLRGNLE